MNFWDALLLRERSTAIGLLWWVVTLGLIVVLIVLATQARDSVKLPFEMWDKAAHFLGYGVLGVAGTLAVYHSMELGRLKALLLGVFLAGVIGVLTEVLQGTLAQGRSADVYDALADLLGAFVLGGLLCVVSAISESRDHREKARIPVISLLPPGTVPPNRKR